MRYLLLSIFLLSAYSSLSQDYLTSVRHYNEKDGLNSRNIRFGFKDSQGFLWFTSKSGAYRFDGYQFISYKRKLDRENPFEMNHLGEDSEKNIWFFHNKTGNKLTDISILPNGKDSLVSFDHFFYSKTPFPAKNIFNVFFNNQNHIHIVLIDGKIFEYANQKFSQIFQIPAPTLLKLSTVNVLKKDDNYHYIYSNRELFKLTPTNFLEKRDSISFLVPHHHGYQSYNYLYSAFFLFFQFDITSELKKLYHQGKELNLIPSNSNHNNKYLLNNKDSHLYDLELINLEKNIKIDIEPFGIPNTIISPRSFFVENENSIWLMAHDGVYHIKFIKKRFNNFLPGNSTREIIKDENQNVWVASDQGLHKINLINGNVQTKTGKKWRSGRGLFLEKNNTLWVTKLSGWIQKINTLQFEIQHEYLFRSNQRDNKVSNFIRRDKKTNQLWVGTASGLFKYDSLSNDFLNFEQSNNFPQVGSLNMFHFFENDEFILIATTKGIFQLDPQNGIIQHFSTKNNTLPCDNIIFIHQDKKDNSFWLGTKFNGLIHWNKKTGQTKAFTKKDGLIDNLIYAVYEDEEGNLWLPSNYGLMQFNKESHDIVTYTTKDGLPNNEFNYHSHYQDKEGTLYMGGLNGITVFHPKNFTTTTQENAPLHLTSFKVFDEKNRTMVSQWSNFKQHKKIILQPNDNSFSLSFALLDFKNPEENQFEYKIDGYNKNWISLDDNNLRINNLPHGEYTIVVKGRNSNGQWSNQHLKIPVKVLQPFYSKWWFKILTAIIMIGLIFFIIQRRTSTLLIEKEKLEKEVTRRTKEIKAQAEELKKLDKVKTRFFANVTHELRTPLTLIISPIKQLMKTENLNDNTMRTLTAIAQNGEQLKNLVEEILDLSRYDTSKLEIHKKPIHFLAEIRKWATGFDLEAQHRGINFQLFYQLPIELHLMVDDQKLKKIVTNLLTNAFKFTQNGDSITLEIFEKNNNILLKVIDTGQGIHPEDLPHIFKRFFQTKQTNTNLHGGLGIGLALSKELATLMKGDISVQSIYGSGATFILKIPKEISTTPIHESIPEPVTIEPPLPLSKKNNSKYNILIVEDNIQMRVFIQGLLHSNANTFLAANGKDALKILEKKETEIHLIISDVMMPEMDGFTLLEKLKSSEKWQLIPVIMLTALSNTVNKLKAITIGVDDYVIKPFEADELIARVNTLLQNTEQRKNISIEVELDAKEKELPPLESADLKWLKKLEMIAFQNVTKPNFKVSQLAFEMAIGERQFNRRLKKITGLTPGNYLKEIKLQKARQLLENKVYPTIAEVAYSVGFSTPEYFSKIFKNRFGKSPSDYFKN